MQKLSQELIDSYNVKNFLYLSGRRIHVGDYLLAGKQEVFLRESSDQQVLTFQTNQWLDTGESYEMPVVCFRTSDINGLFDHLCSNDIRIGEMLVNSWFREFDFYDPDGNKLKVWQPNE